MGGAAREVVGRAGREEMEEREERGMVVGTGAGRRTVSVWIVKMSDGRVETDGDGGVLSGAAVAAEEKTEVSQRDELGERGERREEKRRGEMRDGGCVPLATRRAARTRLRDIIVGTSGKYCIGSKEWYAPSGTR